MEGRHAPAEALAHHLPGNVRHPVDRDSKYYDAAASPEQPRWANVDVQALRKVRLITLAELRAHPQLSGMAVLRRGNRLSITPVTAAQWKIITTVLARPQRAGRNR